MVAVTAIIVSSQYVCVNDNVGFEMAVKEVSHGCHHRVRMALREVLLGSIHAANNDPNPTQGQAT